MSEQSKEGAIATNCQSLLIIGCSQRKSSNPSLLPAIIRYDGPTFLVLRRFLRQQPLESREISVYILSAEFGLIPQNRLIPYYDRRMTRTRARELQSAVIAELENILNAKPYQELFICLGQDYLQAINGYETMISARLTVRIASGGLGKKLAELHDWLYGRPPELSQSSPKAVQRGKKPQIRGIEVALTPEQVLDVACLRLESGNQEFTRFQSWYVPIGTHRVAPKWLVSQLTGLSVSDFTTQEARRLLAQLGIQVRRV